jgi:hypothetical protein
MRIFCFDKFASRLSVTGRHGHHRDPECNQSMVSSRTVATFGARRLTAREPLNHTAAILRKKRTRTAEEHMASLSRRQVVKAGLASGLTSGLAIAMPHIARAQQAP